MQTVVGHHLRVFPCQLLDLQSVEEHWVASHASMVSLCRQRMNTCLRPIPLAAAVARPVLNARSASGFGKDPGNAAPKSLVLHKNKCGGWWVKFWF